MKKEIERNYLEINSLEDLNETSILSEDYFIKLVESRDFQLNKFFYKNVGKNHHWIDRLIWTDQQAAVSAPVGQEGVGWDEINSGLIPAIEELKAEVMLIDVNDDSLNNYYDSLIGEKTKEAKAKKLFSTYEINHFFTLKERYGNPILYEYNFIL